MQHTQIHTQACSTQCMQHTHKYTYTNTHKQFELAMPFPPIILHYAPPAAAPHPIPVLKSEQQLD